MDSHFTGADDRTERPPDTESLRVAVVAAVRSAELRTFVFAKCHSYALSNDHPSPDQDAEYQPDAKSVQEAERVAIACANQGTLDIAVQNADRFTHQRSKHWTDAQPNKDTDGRPTSLAYHGESICITHDDCHIRYADV